MFANRALRKFCQRYQHVYKFSTGNLYTWGNYSSGTGYKIPNDDPSINTPKRVETFNGNVVKVATGFAHTAVLTEQGEIFTFGNGEFGQLGHETCGNVPNPKRVDFFADKGLKVTNINCGFNHTFAVTSDGKVWSWGFGGNESGISSFFGKRFGALGIPGLSFNRSIPTQIESFSNVGKVRWLSSGNNFAFAINENNDVFSWGDGQLGSLADGLCQPVRVPTPNDNFKILKDKHHLTIQKIKSASEFAVGLFSDGNLYAWGKNNGGAMGIAKQLGHVTDEQALLPTPVCNDAYKGQKVVEFDVGEDTLVLLTDKGQVFWSGVDLAYKPIKWELPADVKIQKVVASKGCFAALSEDGKVFMFNEFAAPFSFDMVNEFYTAPQDLFGNKKVLALGGKYGVRFAVVEK